MRKGILVTAVAMALLNLIVVVLLIQVSRVPTGAVVPLGSSAPSPVLRRQESHKPPMRQPFRPFSAPQAVPPASAAPESRPEIGPILVLAGLAAGGSLLVVVLTILLLLNARKSPAPVSRSSVTQPVPAAWADANPPAARTEAEWRGNSPPVHREAPPTPTLVIPESLRAPQPSASLAGKSIPLSEEERPWIALAQECVDLYEEMVSAGNDSVPADHVRSRLQELLERSGVEVIEDEMVFQRTRHQAQGATRMIADGTPIRQTISPGFAVRNLVLCRANVQIAD